MGISRVGDLYQPYRVTQMVGVLLPGPDASTLDVIS